MNNLLTQNSTCFLANALIFLYYGKMQTIWQEIFSLYEFNPPKAIFLYAERALGCITEKQANHLTRDFFVRQFKVLEGYILICREGFRLYNGKRSVKSLQQSAV